MYAQHLTTLQDMSRNLWVDGELSGVRDLNEPRDFCELVKRHFPPLNEIPLYIGDRNFSSLNNMACVQTMGRFFVFRAKDVGEAGSLANRLHLPDGACDVDRQLFIGTPAQKPINLPPNALFYSLSVGQTFAYLDWASPFPFVLDLRIIRLPLPNDKWSLEYTNLPRTMFSANEVEITYSHRWQTETGYRRYKYVGDAIVFHAKRDYLVAQEIFGHLLMDNIANALIYDASPPEAVFETDGQPEQIDSRRADADEPDISRRA